MGEVLRPLPGASDARVLLGVMSNPSNNRLRRQIRRWSNQFSSHGRGVDVRFVFGNTVYKGTEEDSAVIDALRRRAHADALFVDGRERLPHVGVVTEKSGWWWRSVADRLPDYDFYCKSDDDTLVHLDRLQSVLSHVKRQLPRANIYTGHMKWRGWDDRTDALSACGGNWGGAHKTMEDLVSHTMTPSGKRMPPCSDAAGPYPYMSGGMVCMSRGLASLMGRDAEFGRFLKLAWARNDAGSPCATRDQCARQPVSRRMWHHEDAGIAYNTFRAVVRANASMMLVPVPGHFDDVQAIERTKARGNLTAMDVFMSARAIFAHNVKRAADYERVGSAWQLDRRSEPLLIRLNCSARGLGGFRWDYARLPCTAAAHVDARGVAGGAGDAGVPPSARRHCEVAPNAHFGCYAWTWLLPELRALILTVLQAAPTRSLRWTELLQRLRAANAAAVPVDIPGCRRDCMRIALPGGAQLHQNLKELELRGDVKYQEGGLSAKTSATGGRGGARRFADGVVSLL